MKLRKLPTSLAILITVFGLISGIILVGQAQRFGKSASGGSVPKSIKITNVNSASFIMSWTTADKTTGAISYGETSSLGEIQKDIRDKKNNNEEKFFTHFVIVDNLKPSTKYFFKVLSSGKAYDNSGKLFDINTAPVKSPADNDIAQGKILTPNGQPAQNTIVYLSLANTFTQAALTDSEGHWVIPLSTARTIDLQNYSSYDREAQIEEILVQGENQTSSAILSTKNDNPSPDITLGQTYNFSEQMPDLKPTPTLIKNQTGFEADDFLGSQESAELRIVFPSENEEVNNSKPEFIGSGPKSQKIEIEIKSEQLISGQAQISKDGNWSWSPKTPLAPGDHKITVSYTDKDGFVKKISRSFIVLAAGESNLPSFTSTPSGQRATPTMIARPTATPLSLTPTPLPVRTTIPNAPSGTPASGTFLPTRIFFATGILTILAGIALVLF